MDGWTEELWKESFFLETGQNLENAFSKNPAIYKYQTFQKKTGS